MNLLIFRRNIINVYGCVVKTLKFTVELMQNLLAFLMQAEFSQSSLEVF